MSAEAAAAKVKAAEEALAAAKQEVATVRAREEARVRREKQEAEARRRAQPARITVGELEDMAAECRRLRDACRSSNHPATMTHAELWADDIKSGHYWNL